MRGSGNDVAGAKMVTEEAEINHVPSRQTDRARRNSDIWTVDSLGRTRADERRSERNTSAGRIRVKAAPLSVSPSVCQFEITHSWDERGAIVVPDRQTAVKLGGASNA